MPQQGWGPTPARAGGAGPVGQPQPGNRQQGWRSSITQEESDRDVKRGTGDVMGPSAMRTLIPLAGTAVGSLGGPVGMAVGGGVAGALAEYLAQKSEGRADVGELEIILQGLINAAPMKGGSALSTGLRSGAASAVGNLGTEIGTAEDMDAFLADLTGVTKRTAAAGAFGGVLGAGVQKGFDAAGMGDNLGGDRGFLDTILGRNPSATPAGTPEITLSNARHWDGKGPGGAVPVQARPVRAAANTVYETPAQAAMKAANAAPTPGVPLGTPPPADLSDVTPMPAFEPSRFTPTPGVQGRSAPEPTAGMSGASRSRGNLPLTAQTQVLGPGVAPEALADELLPPAPLAPGRQGGLNTRDRLGSAVDTRPALEAPVTRGVPAAWNDAPAAPLSPANQGGVAVRDRLGDTRPVPRQVTGAPALPDGLGPLDDGLLPLGPNKQGTPALGPTAGMAGASRSRGDVLPEPDGLEALDPILPPMGPQFQGFNAPEPTRGMAGASRSAGEAPPSPFQTGPAQPFDPFGTEGDPLDNLLAMFQNKPSTSGAAPSSFQVLDPTTATLNGSGESGASLEAIRRLEGMKGRGEEFGVFDRTGQYRSLQGHGAEAVDYKVQPGETYGVMTPEGFQVRDNAGGRVPPPGTPPPAPIADVADGPAGEADLGDLGALDEILGLPPAAPKKLFVPAEHVTSHQKIRDMIKTSGKGDVEPNLLDYSTRLQTTENDRKLMGTERTAQRAAKARVGDRLLDPRPTDNPGISGPQAFEFPGPMADDAGQIDNELLTALGLHGGGAFVGGTAAALAGDEEDRGRNFAGGAVAGAAAPLIWRNPELLQRARYGAMLSGTGAQLSNVIGGFGAGHLKALEEVLQGNTGQAGRIVSEMWSPETAKGIKRAWDTNEGQWAEGGTRWGRTEGALGMPSRALHAVDEGYTDALTRAGLTQDEATETLFTNTPKSKTGQYLSERGPMLSMVAPFVKTASNMVERGLEHTPGVAMLPWVQQMRNPTKGQSGARQAMGALAMLASGAGMLPEEGTSGKLADAALGPLALPANAMAQIRDRIGRGEDPTRASAGGFVDTMRDMAPIASEGYDYDPGRYLASFVPGALGAFGDSPSEFRTDKTLFDPAIAKIPGFQSTLPRKPPTRRRSSPAATRSR